MSVVRRLSNAELFRPVSGPQGFEAVSDATIDRLLDKAEREQLRRGYQAAVAEEMLQQPEAV